MRSFRTPPRPLLVSLLLLGLVACFYLMPRQDRPPPASADSPANVPPASTSPVPLDPADLSALLSAARTAPAAPSHELIAAFTARRAHLARLVREEPEAALAAALTPHEYASLPPELQALAERPLAGVGFYGVLAICTHDPLTGHSAACRIERHVFLEGREIPVTIYGSRRDRITEEEASLYGVELDGVLALHADDAVVLPAERMSDDPARAGQLALIHRGHVSFFADRASLDAHLARTASP